MRAPIIWVKSRVSIDLSYIPHKVVTSKSGSQFIVVDWAINHDPGDEDDGVSKSVERMFKDNDYRRY